MHLIHCLKRQGQTVQMLRAQPAVKLAFLVLRCRFKKQHKEDESVLKHLKALRDE